MNQIQLKSHRINFGWLALLVALLITAGASAATPTTKYIVTDLGVFSGFTSSFANSINNAGQVVGSVSGPNSDFAFLWQPSASRSTTGSLVNLGDFAGGTDNSSSFSINSVGQIVGSSSTTTGLRGFLWQPSAPNAVTGSMFNLGDLPGGRDQSVAYGINSVGQIAGESYNALGARAYLWQPDSPNGTMGSIVDIDPLVSNEISTAHAINDSGQIVGSLTKSSGPTAFLWKPSSTNNATGTIVELPHFASNSNSSAALSINSSGEIVGSSNSTSGFRAFLWRPTAPNDVVGTLINLGALPGFDNQSSAYAINSLEQIVGDSGSTGNTHAFVWNAAFGMLDLNSLLDPSAGAGWQLTTARGINDYGQIVGSGVHNGVTHAFLLTPVPEPITITSVFVALAILLFANLRKR